MSHLITVEIAANSFHSALDAQQGGAHRVELCEFLEGGGVTPSYGSLALTREHLRIPLFVLIRPRVGDFVYDEYERDIMLRDIDMCRRLACDGVVVGALTQDGEIDLALCSALIAAAGTMAVTFHRAFDVVADPGQALETLTALRVDRILTSGQARTAMEGLIRLTQLAQKAAGRISIMPASGINAQNVRQILAATDVNEIHIGSAVTAIKHDSSAEWFAAARGVVEAQKVRDLRRYM